MSFSITPFTDFESASRAVLKYLHHKLGFGLWMVTRVDGDDWIVLQSEDHGYGVADGDIFNWLDSYCSRMIQDLGPRVAPRSNDIPVYAAAPIGQQVPIAAYIGVPIPRNDGSCFGTLCAIDPAPQPDGIVHEQSLIELLANLLSTVLESELCVLREQRRAERADMEAMTDSLTGLFNRRGWERLTASEEARCRRYGHSACILSIDVDGLKQINDQMGHAQGDEYIASVAAAISWAVRESDIVARMGGDEFAIMAVECEESDVLDVMHRIEDHLATTTVGVSIGYAFRGGKKTVEEALAEADEMMYARKREKYGQGPNS